MALAETSMILSTADTKGQTLIWSHCVWLASHRFTHFDYWTHPNLPMWFLNVPASSMEWYYVRHTLKDRNWEMPMWFCCVWSHSLISCTLTVKHVLYLYSSFLYTGFNDAMILSMAHTKRENFKDSNVGLLCVIRFTKFHALWSLNTSFTCVVP